MKTFFLTPLAAKNAVRNWQLTCDLLRETLFSLEQQTCGDFESIVCCHDVPEFAAGLDPRFRFVQHPFEAPTNAYANSGVNNGIRDMMLKRDVALYHASPAASDFVMLLDADDLLHRDLVKMLNGADSFDAALFESGYEYCQKSNRLLKRSDMVGRTTSSFALRGRLVRVPATLQESDLAKSIYHEVWHSNVRQYLESRGLPTLEPAGPDVIYRVNTTLNRSDWYRVNGFRRWRHHIKFLIGRRVKESDRSDFGVEKFVGVRR